MTATDRMPVSVVLMIPRTVCFTDAGIDCPQLNRLSEAVQSSLKAHPAAKVKGGNRAVEASNKQDGPTDQSVESEVAAVNADESLADGDAACVPDVDANVESALDPGSSYVDDDAKDVISASVDEPERDAAESDNANPPANDDVEAAGEQESVLVEEEWGEDAIGTTLTSEDAEAGNNAEKMDDDELLNYEEIAPE